MVSEQIQTALLVGIFTVLGSAVTGIATYLATVKQQEAANNRTELRQRQENRRYLANFYIEQKVKIFLDAYDAMFHFHTRLSHWREEKESDTDDVDTDEITESYEDLMDTLRHCWIFLSTDEISTVREYEKQIEGIYRYLVDSSDEEGSADYDLEEIWTAYHFAEQVITEEISKPVSLFESELDEESEDEEAAQIAREVARSEEEIRRIFRQN